MEAKVKTQMAHCLGAEEKENNSTKANREAGPALPTITSQSFLIKTLN